MSAARSARARSTSRCVRALAIAVAACEANRTRISSSASVNAPPSSLSARKKLPRCPPLVVHRGPLHRLRAPGVRGEAKRAEVVVNVRHPERGGKVAEVPEEPFAVGPLVHLPALLGRKPGGDEVLDPAPTVDRRDHAGAGTGEGPRAIDHLFEHGGQVEARADAQDRRAQPRRAVTGLSVSGAGRDWIAQCSTRFRRVGRSRKRLRPVGSAAFCRTGREVEDSGFCEKSH